jgi:hypothetical protein
VQWLEWAGGEGGRVVVKDGRASLGRRSTTKTAAGQAIRQQKERQQCRWDGRGRKDHERVQLVVWTGGTCAGGASGRWRERESRRDREQRAAAVVRAAVQCAVCAAAAGTSKQADPSSTR